MAGTQRLGAKAKTVAAVVGGGAMVALGVVGAVSGGSESSAPSIVSVGEMTMGATATAAYSATMETSMAVPQDKAKPYGGSGS